MLNLSNSRDIMCANIEKTQNEVAMLDNFKIIQERDSSDLSIHTSNEDEYSDDEEEDS